MILSRSVVGINANRLHQLFVESNPSLATAAAIISADGTQISITVPDDTLPSALSDVNYSPPAVDNSSVFDNQKWLKALGIACSNLTLAGVSWSTAGYTPTQIKNRTIAAYQSLP